MSRNYPKIRPHMHQVYSVEDVMRLYSVSRNTISNWIGGGLKPSACGTPQLFHGAELGRFHIVRRARRKLRSGEFKCFGCKEAVFPELETLVLDRTGPRLFARAACPDCDGPCERFVGFKDVPLVTAEDVNGWRSELVARAGKRKEDGGLSRSSVRHLASHLKAFMTWLIHQHGHKDLAGLEDYFALPRAIHAQNGCERPRAYPSLNEAKEMLSGLPFGTLKDRRDRAIFAAAFASGFREQALISLRLHHVDLMRKQMFHDGETLRAKNGKSFMVKWFPQTEAFQQVFTAWVEEMRGFGLAEDEAVFPDNADLAQLASEGQRPVQSSSL